jgi:hypothetical protein
MSFIAVRSTEVGWRLDADTFDNELHFRSGGEAERAARRLAEHYAAAGEDAVVAIYLRDGALAARFEIRPDDVAGEGDGSAS